MHGMSEPFHRLLEATIQYLQDLKAGGGQFISVSPETLSELCQPAGRPLAARSAGSAPPQSSSRPALSVAPRAAGSSDPAPGLAKAGERALVSELFAALGATESAGRDDDWGFADPADRAASGREKLGDQRSFAGLGQARCRV